MTSSSRSCSVQKDYDVSVLLDGPALAQVRQPGRGIRPLLDGARKLGAGHDRDVELAGKRFEGPGDLGDLLHPIVAVDRRTHQLQVVDDEQPDAVFAVHAPGLAAQLEHRERRRIVNQNRIVTQLGHRCDGSPKLVVVQGAVPDAHRINARVVAHDSLRQLMSRHLQGKEADWYLLAVHPRLQRQMQRKRRLSHARSGGQDDQVRALQATRQLVQLADAGGHAAEQPAMLHPEHQLVVELVQNLAQRLEIAGSHLVGDPEDQAFGVIQHSVRVGAGAIGFSHHLPSRLDDSAQDAGPPHDGGVVLHVERRGHRVNQVCDIRWTACEVQALGPSEFIRYRHGVRAFVARGDIADRVKDGAVLLAIEVVGLDLTADGAHGIGVDQQASQQ